MSDITRRDALRRLGLVIAGGGLLDRGAAREVHAFAAQSQAAAGGAYTPKSFTAHQYRTLQRLTDLIIPVENGKPGALAAGAPAWIDMISSENDQLKTTYGNGFTWLDAAMKERGAADFVSATPAQQAELLDLIAYRRNRTPELGPGIDFFAWVRRMTVDAFYTSEIGFRDIDYQGNTPLGAYPSPAESIAYALKKSGLG